MTANGWLQIALYCVIIIALREPFGGYMTRVFNGERTFLSPRAAPGRARRLWMLRRRREGRSSIG